MAPGYHRSHSRPNALLAKFPRFTHEPMEGFLLRESDPVAASGRHVMSWQGRNDVSRLAGQAVRLRFSMKNAKLYSFQFR